MDPYYMPMGPSYDQYYAAIHSYSQDIARSAKEEIDKQAEELRNFRRTMLAQELDNEKLKAISTKLHSEILRLAEDKTKMKKYMESLEQKNKDLQQSLEVTSEELLAKEERSTEEIKKMNSELMKLNEEKNTLQEKFLKLELEYIQQQKNTELLFAEKMKAEKSLKQLESTNDLQISENDKLRHRLKKEREARVLLEDWERKRLQRLAMMDPLARAVPPAVYPSLYLPGAPLPVAAPPPGLESVPTSDVMTKLKLLESELQAEAEAAKTRSAKIAQRWGTSQTHNGRISEAASSKN